MINLEHLPRTVELVSNTDRSPVFRYVDQRKLPAELVIASTASWVQVVDAIKTLAVRGAPALGATGAAALALWVADYAAKHGGSTDNFEAKFTAAAKAIAYARPTAVNLQWGGHQVQKAVAKCIEQGASMQEVTNVAITCVKEIEQRDEAANRAIGEHGAALVAPESRILTHCNAGSLATVFYGTALGVVYAAAEQGKIAHVYADETRPVGQGARLTAWELAQVGVPTTLICDNMAASLMAQSSIDMVVVGADRIAANGDVANKIGTYGVAVLAKHHDIPFYVAAPTSTIDATLATGAAIPIEQRDPAEVAAPLAGVQVYNPAFDVTPASLITGIITEQGVYAPERIADALSH